MEDFGFVISSVSGKKNGGKDYDGSLVGSKNKVIKNIVNKVIQEGVMKNVKRWLALAGMSLVLMLGGCGTPKQGMPEKEQEKKGTVTRDVSTDMEVHFLDVGQGDCTLIRNDGKVLLIDAGPEERKLEVQEYLRGLGVTKLDYVIGTRADEECLGGMDMVLCEFEIGKVFLPNKMDTFENYPILTKILEEKELTPVSSEPQTIYELGDAAFQVIPTVWDEQEKNGGALAVQLVQEKNCFLFCEDMASAMDEGLAGTKEGFSNIVYKVPNHGSDYSILGGVPESVSSGYAIISCGRDSLPEENLLKGLEERCLSVFRTDEQGTIIGMSNGADLSWNVELSKVMKPIH